MVRCPHRRLRFLGVGCVLALASCGQSRTQSGTSSTGYSGTIVVGHDYVQALVTAPGFDGCPPRTQNLGECVRTPPRGSSCDPEKRCITQIEVSDASGAKRARSEGPFVQVPWLSSTESASLTIKLAGCGGMAAMSVPLKDVVAPLENASAVIDGKAISFSWSGATSGDQVCGLWRWSSGIEVCCSGDTGAATFATPTDGATTDARLSRGRLLVEQGDVRIYRTRETGNLLNR